MMPLLLLLAVSICIPATPLFGTTHVPNNRTFYAHGADHVSQLPHTLALHKPTPSPDEVNPDEEIKTDEYIETPVSISGYYHASSNKKKFGEYFGFYDTEDDAVYNFIGVSADDDKLAFPQDFIHDKANSDAFNDKTLNPLSEKIFFNPHVEEYGFLISGQTKITENSYFSLGMPYMHRTHILGLVSKNKVTQEIKKNDGSTKSISLMDYLQGNVEQVLDPNKQRPLKYGKLKETQSISGPADLHARVSFVPVRDEKTALTLGLQAILPTTSGSTGEYLFEPLLGTGGHWFLGVHAHGIYKFKDLENGSVHMGGHLSHMVGFERQQIRSLNFINASGLLSERGRYYLIGKHGSSWLRPFLNNFTQPLHVTPGQTTQLSIYTELQNRVMTGHLGYKLDYTGKEKVRLSQSTPTNTYGSSKYGFNSAGKSDGDAKANYAAFDVTKTVFNSEFYSDESLHLDSAATPAQTTHTLFIHLSCTPFGQGKTKLDFAGLYHFCNKKQMGREGWSISGKLSHQF